MCAFWGEKFVCMKLHDCVLLLVSVRRCVIDKEDKHYVCMTHVLSVCVMCVCLRGPERGEERERGMEV